MGSARRTRFSCVRPKTRARVAGLRNFRDEGREVGQWLLDLLTRLQKTKGQCWSSEAGLREMIFQDHGHMAGVDTIRKCLQRFHREGLLSQWEVPASKPGQSNVLPDGSRAVHGTRVIRVPQTTKEKSAVLRLAEEWGGKRPVDKIEGLTLRQRDAFEAMRKALAGAMPRPQPGQADRGAARARELRVAIEETTRALEAQWRRQDGGGARGRAPPPPS